MKHFQNFALFLLVCSAGWRVQGVLIIGEGRRLTVVMPDGFSFPLERSTAGDCAKRQNCYQSGQFMLNLTSDKKRAWINTDTDDIPGRGLAVECRERK